MKNVMMICVMAVFMLAVSGTAWGADADVTPDVIFGDGNANGNFTVNQSGGVELGLRAKIPYIGEIYSGDDGTYSYTLEELWEAHASQRWNFDWTVNTDYLGTSGVKIDNLTYVLGVDFDSSQWTDFVEFDPITPPPSSTTFPDHSIGDNNTLNGEGTEANSIADYADLIASNNVLQQSWRIPWVPPHPTLTYDPTIDGTYDIVLSAFDSGSNLVASTSIQVIIGAGGFPVHNITQGTYYSTIQDGIDAADADDVIEVDGGTYVITAQIVIDKNITLRGAGKSLTTIEPGFDTTVGYYLISDALVYVDYGVTATIEDLAIDGTGHTVRHAIQSRGTDLTVKNCDIRNIYANNYAGRGIVFLTGTGLVENCTMSDIQRIGVHIRGAIEPNAPSVTVDGLSYTGKGTGDFLDYGVEFGGGGTGIVQNSTITNCRGVASDESTSAGILVTDYYGTGTTADILNSELSGNSAGLHVGYADVDISEVEISGCNISGNTDYGVITTGVEVVASCNWWGNESGPTYAGNPGGSGDAVTDNVDYSPWLNAEVGGICAVDMLNFHVKKFELKPAKKEVKFDAEFKLGGESDGLDPGIDETTLVVSYNTFGDVLNVTIPAPSWSCKEKDGIVKECKVKVKVVGGAKMEVKLKPDKKEAGKWKFSFKGKNMVDIGLPASEGVDVTLTIGDDKGSETDVPVKVKK